MATNSLITSDPNRSCSPESGPSTIAGDAPQPIVRSGEPKPQHSVEAAGAAKFNRRSIMNMMVSAAAVANSSAAFGGDNSIIAGTGAQFESLFTEYFNTSVEWARLHRSAHATFTEKLGRFYRHKNTPEGEADYRILDTIFESNGCDRASDRMAELYDQMNPLADVIKEASSASILDLRWKTLVALWEALPSDAYSDGELNLFSEYDGGALRVMFDAAVSLTNLEPLVKSIKNTLSSNACADPRDSEEVEEPPTTETDTTATPADNGDPVFGLIEAHKTANAEYGAALKVLIPGTHSPDPEKEMEFGDRERDACWELTTTAPKTLAGTLAVINYIKGVTSGEFSSNGRPDLAFDDDRLLNVLINTGECMEAHLNMLDASGIA